MAVIVINPWVEVPASQHHYMGRVYYKNGIYACHRRCNICDQNITWETRSLRAEEAKTCRDYRVVRREFGNNSECRDWTDIRNVHKIQTALEKEETRSKVSMSRFFRMLKQGKII